MNGGLFLVAAAAYLVMAAEMERDCVQKISTKKKLNCRDLRSLNLNRKDCSLASRLKKLVKKTTSF